MSKNSLESPVLKAARGVGLVAHWYLIVVELVLGLGFVLLALGANPSSEFTAWAYRSLERAMQPFRGMFEPIALGLNGAGVSAVFDTTILFAMVIYGLGLVFVNAILSWVTNKIHYLDVQARIHQQELAFRSSFSEARPTPPDVLGDYAARVSSEEDRTSGDD